MDDYLTKFKIGIIKIISDKKLLAKILLISILIFMVFALRIHDSNKEKIVIENNTKTKEEVVDKIFIDISGEVNNPGVYDVNSGSRLYEIIAKAGGLTNKADTNSINQAKVVEDGEKIIIPSKNISSYSAETKNGLININTADKELLKEIPGVGDAIAERIIEYRNKSQFKSIEDIMCVSGIGNATFEKMKSKITV